MTIREFDVERAVSLWESGMRYRDIAEEMNTSFSIVAAILGGLGLHRDSIAARRRTVNLLAARGESVEDIAKQTGLGKFTVSAAIRQMPAGRARNNQNKR